MDDRQRHIEVGKGLQESRLNTDLIAWLEKWGTWILFAVLLVVAFYAGSVKYKAWRAQKLDDAFAQYTAARGEQGADGVFTGSPDSLLVVAREHEGQGSVSLLATLDAAEIYLGCARRGLRPGADTVKPAAEDTLTPEKSAEMIKSADGLFRDAVARAGARSELSPLLFRALWGEASTAISMGEMDRAKAELQRAHDLAASQVLTEQAAAAKRRLDELPAFATEPKLYTTAELPTPPGAALPSDDSIPLIPVADPSAAPAGAVKLPTAPTDDVIQSQPADMPPPRPAPAQPPAGQPAPAPAPAPAENAPKPN